MNKIFFSLLLIQIIICSKFPIYEKIEESSQGDEKVVDIKNIDEYNNYIKNFDNVIVLFHIDWCVHCKKFIPIFYKASSYKIVNSKWKFLKMSCSLNKHICDYLKIDKFPTISVYKQHKLLNIEPTHELVPLLEFLLKVSSDSIIEINSKDEFIKNYGSFSPIIEIPTGENNENFISCIKKYANNEYMNNFYFGLLKNSNTKNAKITFDNDGFPISFEWDEYCENVGNFLYENKYPLISKIDTVFLKEMKDDPRIILMLITYPSNEDVKIFLNNVYKNIALRYRRYVFGYVDYEEEKDIPKYFNVQLFSENELKIVVYDYEKEMHYINSLIFILNERSEKLISQNIEWIAASIPKLELTSGSGMKDFLYKFGLLNMSPTKQIIVILSILFGFLGLMILLAFCCSKKNIGTNFDEDNNGTKQKIN